MSQIEPTTTKNNDKTNDNMNKNENENENENKNNNMNDNTGETSDVLKINDNENLYFEIDPNDGQGTLRGLGYYYTKDGKCRSVKSNEKVGRFKTQQLYEEFGDAVEEFIFFLLVNKYDLNRITLEENKKKKLSAATIFHSKDYLDKETLMCLIPGSGSVRSSQWARSICINNELENGTCFPFIQSCFERDYGVLLFDPNVRINKSSKNRGDLYPTKHCNYVFKKYVIDEIKNTKNCKIKNIFIVAHSAGGYCTTNILEEYNEYLYENNLIRGIAFTDCGDPGKNWIDKKTYKIYKKVGRNWVTSVRPLGELLTTNGTLDRYSSGHTKHEWTSASAYRDIFRFFDKNINLKVSYNYLNNTTNSKKITDENNENNNNKNDDNDKEMKEKTTQNNTMNKTEKMDVDE